MKKLKVLFFTDWSENHYKTLLINHLKYQDVQVEECFAPTNTPLQRTFFLHLVLRHGKFDILHFHTLPAFLIGKNILSRIFKLLIFVSQIFILNIIGTKIVWTVHEWHDKVNFDKINIMLPEVIGNCLHAIITHCETTKNDIAKALKINNKEKIFVVPHGHYIDAYENKISQLEARKTLGIPPKNLVFVIFGGIYRYKGVLEAIDAFKNLKYPDIYLVVAGQPYEAQLKEIILDKIEGHENILFFPQRIPDNDIQIYINASDCLVVSYRVFTTSGVAILGMSYGKACIAPKVGFFSDVLDEYGSFLYDSNDKNGLVKAMECSIKQKEKLPKMGTYNFKIAQNWNWKYVSQETLHVYRFCLL